MWGAGIGLLVLLMGVGLYLYLEGSSAETAIKAAAPVKAQIQQYGGVDEAGNKSIDSAKLEGLSEGGKLRGLLVDSVVADGSYAKFFGLQKDDTITGLEYNGFKRKLTEFPTEDEARGEVDEAFRKSGHLFVLRDEKEVELPSGGGAGSAKSGKSSGDPLQSQLDAIQNSGR